MARIKVAATNSGGRDCDICYHVQNLSTGKEAAKAKTGLLFFDYETRRPVHMPADFRKRLFTDLLSADSPHA